MVIHVLKHRTPGVFRKAIYIICYIVSANRLIDYRTQHLIVAVRNKPFRITHAVYRIVNTKKLITSIQHVCVVNISCTYICIKV